MRRKIEVWIALSLRFAITSHQFRMRVRLPAARCARVVHESFAQTEGVGNAGRPPHPQPRVQSVESTRHPAFPHAMVLTAYFVLSPVIGLYCHRRLRIEACLRPVGPTCLRKLDEGVEASGPHGFAVRVSVVRQRAVDRSQAETRPAIPSRAQRCRVHRIPPRVRDDRDTPLWGTRRQRI